MKTLLLFWWEFTLHTLIYTFSFEIVLPHIAVIPSELDIKISAIYVESGIPPKCFDLLYISAKQGMFR